MRLRIRLVAALATSVMSAAVGACGASDNGGALGPAAPPTRAPTSAGSLRGQLPPALAAAGSLRVGIAGDRPPFVYGPDGADPAGLDRDLVDRAASALGVKVQYVPVLLAGLPAAVAAHQVDLALSGLAAQRTAGVTFVDYLRGQLAVEVKPGLHVATSISDLCGRVVGVVAGTTASRAMAFVKSDCTTRGGAAPVVRPSASSGALASAVGSGGVDAGLDDALVASYLAHNAQGPLALAGPPTGSVTYGVAVAADQLQLRDALAAALRSEVDDGSYAAALSRWGASVGTLPITADAGA